MPIEFGRKRKEPKRGKAKDKPAEQ
jgi:hypothetical protein